MEYLSERDNVNIVRLDDCTHIWILDLYFVYPGIKYVSF